MIIGLNYVLQKVCTFLIDKIGYPTETRRLANVTKLTFYSTFLNTAILPVLVEANLQEQIFSFGLAGSYKDFNSDWFRLTGNVIVGAMIFNMMYPIIEYLLDYSTRLLLRFYDRGCTLDFNDTTKTNSVRRYIDLHAGPTFYIHFKYAAILNIVFVTMLFGFGMPILFPIAAISFAIMYFLETTLLYYAYRAPPAYEMEISQTVLKLMMWAPLFYLAFGYWMASSE